MAKNKAVWVVLVVVVLLGAVWLVRKNISQPKQEEAATQDTSSQDAQKQAPTNKGALKIGFISPLTGDAASIGTVNKAAVELAVDEVNAAGGINGKNLEVIYEDGQCNAKAATNAASKLIDVDKVPVILGGLCSTETSAFAPGAMQKKVLVLSHCSSAPTLSKTGKYFFRSYPSDLNQGTFAAEYMVNTLKAKKVAILYHISDWGSGLREVFEKRFKELGGTIVLIEGTKQDNKDYKTQLAKVKAAQPDYIYAPMYPEGSIAALNQAKELGITTKMLGGDAWADTKLQKEISGKGDYLYTEPVSAYPEDFKAKVLAKTKGEQVPICTGNAYDNVKMIAEVLKSAGTDPDKMTEALRATKYDGVSGHIEFDKNGDVTTSAYVVKRITNGKSEEVK